MLKRLRKIPIINIFATVIYDKLV